MVLSIAKSTIETLLKTIRHLDEIQEEDPEKAKFILEKHGSSQKKLNRAVGKLENQQKADIQTKIEDKIEALSSSNLV